MKLIISESQYNKLINNKSSNKKLIITESQYKSLLFEVKFGSNFNNISKDNGVKIDDVNGNKFKFKVVDVIGGQLLLQNTVDKRYIFLTISDFNYKQDTIEITYKTADFNSVGDLPSLSSNLVKTINSSWAAGKNEIKLNGFKVYNNYTNFSNSNIKKVVTNEPAGTEDGSNNATDVDDVQEFRDGLKRNMKPKDEYMFIFKDESYLMFKIISKQNNVVSIDFNAVSETDSSIDSDEYADPIATRVAEDLNSNEAFLNRTNIELDLNDLRENSSVVDSDENKIYLIDMVIYFNDPTSDEPVNIKYTLSDLININNEERIEGKTIDTVSSNQEKIYKDTKAKLAADPSLLHRKSRWPLAGSEKGRGLAHTRTRYSYDTLLQGFKMENTYKVKFDYSVLGRNEDLIDRFETEINRILDAYGEILVKPNRGTVNNKIILNIINSKNYKLEVINHQGGDIYEVKVRKVGRVGGVPSYEDVGTTKISVNTAQIAKTRKRY